MKSYSPNRYENPQFSQSAVQRPPESWAANDNHQDHGGRVHVEQGTRLFGDNFLQKKVP